MSGLALCPGAVPLLGEGGNLVAGPPRASWHFTADALRSDGSPGISFRGVTDYLRAKRYEPHLVWEPWTGEIYQLLKPTQSGRALARPRGSQPTNTFGAVHLQVEAYFTPGVTRDGKRYATLADTPCVGLDRILAWMDSWGIPRVAPLAHLDRNAAVWYGRAGHYEHGNTPSNDHWDIGISVDRLLGLAGAVAAPNPPPPRPKEDDTMDPFTLKPGESRRVPLFRDRGGAVAVLPQRSAFVTVVDNKGGLDDRWGPKLFLEDHWQGQWLGSKFVEVANLPDSAGPVDVLVTIYGK